MTALRYIMQASTSSKSLHYAAVVYETTSVRSP